MIKMRKNTLKELTDIVGEEQINLYKQRNKHFRNEYIQVVGNIAKQTYGVEPIIGVVIPRDPFIDSRVLVVPPEREKSQKYVLLQTFGGGYISTVDVVSLPEGLHDNIQKKYVDNILKQFLWYYVAGGHIKFKDRDKIKIYGASTDFGKSMAGYDSNSIAGYILGLTKKFKEVSVDKDESLRTDPDEFFDIWLDLFMKTTSDGKPDNFFKQAYKLHREKSSAPLANKFSAEMYIRAMNDPRAQENILHSIVESMFEVQGEAFQEAIKNKFEKNK